MAQARRRNLRGKDADRNALVQVAVEHQVRALQGLSARAQKRALAIARKVLRRFHADLQRLEVGSWGYVARAAVAQQIRAMVAQLVAQQQAALAGHLTVTAQRSAKELAKFLKAMDKLHLGVVRPLRFEVFEWVESNAQMVSKVRLRQYQQSFARYGATAVQAVENEIAATVAFGEPWNKARPYVWSAVRSVVADRQWMVDRILRTETSAAWHGMQLEAMRVEDVDPKDQLMKRLVATFDARTGQDSILLHGQVRKVNESFYDSYFGKYYDAPPNRPNDREVMIPWRKSYGRMYEGGVKQFVADTAATGPYDGVPDTGGKQRRNKRARARLHKLLGKATPPRPVFDPALAKAMDDVEKLRKRIRTTKAKLQRVLDRREQAALRDELRTYRRRLVQALGKRDRLREAYEKRARARVEDHTLGGLLPG